MSVDSVKISASKATAKLSFIIKTTIANPCSIVSADWPSDDHSGTVWGSHSRCQSEPPSVGH